MAIASFSFTFTGTTLSAGLAGWLLPLYTRNKFPREKCQGSVCLGTFYSDQVERQSPFLLLWSGGGRVLSFYSDQVERQSPFLLFWEAASTLIRWRGRVLSFYTLIRWRGRVLSFYTLIRWRGRVLSFYTLIRWRGRYLWSGKEAESFPPCHLAI